MRSSPPEPPQTTRAATAHLQLVGSPEQAADTPATLQAVRASRTNQLRRGRVRTLVAADLLAIVLSFAGTYGLAQLVDPPAVTAPTGVVVALLAASLVMWVGLFTAYRLYESESRALAPATVDEVGHLFHALLAGSLVLLVGGQV